MKFSDFKDYDEPAQEIFRATLDLVFDEGDPGNEYIERLSSEARVVYLVWCIDGEIHNGGFNQFYFNSLGNYAKELEVHLDLIGAKKSRAMLVEANNFFPNGSPSKDREERWRQLETLETSDIFNQRLEELDTKFYKYEDGINQLLDQYVKNN
ncbi:MAG: DMP19 family protein, partial [Chloroflexota bacterium]